MEYSNFLGITLPWLSPLKKSKVGDSQAQRKFYKNNDIMDLYCANTVNKCLSQREGWVIVDTTYVSAGHEELVLISNNTRPFWAAKHMKSTYR